MYAGIDPHWIEQGSSNLLSIVEKDECLEFAYKLNRTDFNKDCDWCKPDFSWQFIKHSTPGYSPSPTAKGQPFASQVLMTILFECWAKKKYLKEVSEWNSSPHLIREFLQLVRNISANNPGPLRTILDHDDLNNLSTNAYRLNRSNYRVCS